MQTAPHAQPSLNRRHDLLIVLAMLSLIGLQLSVVSAATILRRHFWLDEIHTHTLVADANLTHALEALREGADYNPPTLFLLQRFNSWCWGETSEVGLRSFSLLCIVLTLLATYLYLRPLVKPAAAVAATSALWAHPLIAEHAFEARFYAPWCAAMAWYAYCHLRVSRSRWPLGGVILCVLAVAVCTIHYFGVISLGLYLGAYYAANRHAIRRELWPLLSLACGLASLAGCWPWYVQQKHALTIDTWILPPDLARIAEFLAVVVPTFILVVCAVAWWHQRRRAIEGATSAAATPLWKPLAGLWGLIAMPVVLVAFSYAVQPSLIPRYAIVAALGFSAAVAWLVSALPRPVAMLLGVMFFGVGTWQLAAYAELAQQRDQERQQLISTLRATAGDAPVVFESRLDLYPVAHYAPDLRANCVLLDFEDGELRRASPKRTVERDVGRQFARHYPAHFRLLHYSRLHQLERFFLVVLPDQQEAGPDYAGFAVQRVGARIFEVVPGRRDGQQMAKSP